MTSFSKHLRQMLNSGVETESDGIEELKQALNAAPEPIYDPEAEALGAVVRDKLMGRDSLKDELLGRMHAAGMEVRNWTPPPSGVNPEAQRLLDIADRIKAEREAQEISGPVDLGWSPAGPGALNHDFREHNRSYKNISDIY